MTDDYGGQFGKIRKVFDERAKELGLPQEKTYAEIEAEEKENLLNGLRGELAGYQQSAQQKAIERAIQSYRSKLAEGGLSDEEREDLQAKIIDPSKITEQPTEADYGDKMPRVNELLSLIANPDKAQEKAEQESFISRMKGYSERHALK